VKPGEPSVSPTTLLSFVMIERFVVKALRRCHFEMVEDVIHITDVASVVDPAPANSPPWRIRPISGGDTDFKRRTAPVDGQRAAAAAVRGTNRRVHLWVH
jgi:hypothetical protein